MLRKKENKDNTMKLVFVFSPSVSDSIIELFLAEIQVGDVHMNINVYQLLVPLLFKKSLKLKKTSLILIVSFQKIFQNKQLQQSEQTFFLTVN